MNDATTGQSAGMGWPARIITGFLFIAFIATGGMKLAGTETPKHEFERFGYPAWFMTLTGALEVAGAIGLLLPRLAPVAALGLCGVMIGAIATHLRFDPLQAIVAPAVLFVLAGTVVRLRWGELRPGWDS